MYICYLWKMERSAMYEVCPKSEGSLVCFTSSRDNTSKKESCIKTQLRIASCVLLGNILVGYTIGWSAPVARKLQDPKLTPLPYVLSDGEVSWLAAVVGLGVVTGANGCGYSSNIIGRKRCLILGGVLIIVGYSLVTAAVNARSTYVGRIISGLGAGGISVNNLVYIGEISSTNIRGILLVSTGVMHTFGCLLVYSVGPYVSYYSVGGILLALSAVFVVGCFTIPESPMFYKIKGKNSKAKAVLRKLGRQEDIVNYLQDIIKDEDSMTNQKLFTESINQDKGRRKGNRWNWLQVFIVKSNRKAFIITVVLFIIQQTGGSITITFFCTTIFVNAGSSVDPDVATVILGTTQLFGSLVTPLLVEKAGRRILILISTFGCCFCMGLMGVYFYMELTKHPLLSSLRWMPLVLLISFVFFYNTGLGIIPNTLLGEMFSGNVRNSGSCITMSIGWIFGFISSVTFGYMVEYLGSHIMFFIYSAINGFGFIYSVLCVPETKGKSLADIEMMLAN